MKKIDKIITESPLIDELVYYSKIMAFNTVLKDEDESLQDETLESIKTSDIYILCIEGKTSFELFKEYTEVQLKSAGVPYYLIADCLEDKNNIPDNFRPILVKRATSDYIKDYIEINNYYRMLNGYPNKDEPYIYITDKEMIKKLPPNMDLKKPIHLFNIAQIEELEVTGVLETLKENYPKSQYLNFLGTKKIDIYKARKAGKFDILYVREVQIRDIYNDFITRLEINKVYVLKTVYSEAYKLGSIYYDKFITILIIIQSFIDMIINAPEYLIRRDIFDIRTVQYLLESYGVDFYREIPLKYQINMVKNLNTLLKYKSTSRNMIDICALFGFDNVEIFKYYLLKYRNVDINNKYTNYVKTITDPDGNIETIEDNEKNYTLKFFKMPINGDIEEHLRNSNNYSDYDLTTRYDQYWTGDSTAAQIKKTLLNREFNYINSKYISIDSTYELTNLTIDRSYFYTILFQNKDLTNTLQLAIPTFDNNKTFRFNHIICFLYSLMYEYYGYKDNIIRNINQILAVKGFNFQIDIESIQQYMMDNNISFKDMGVEGYLIPDGQIMNYTQLLDIFTNNMKILNHITEMMRLADNKKIYDIYKSLYDALMIIRNDNFEYFFDQTTGSVFKTFYEFLEVKDPILSELIRDVKNTTEDDKKRLKISNLINTAIEAIDTVINTDEFNFLFLGIPTANVESVKEYIRKVINFFKSYTVELLNINNIYLLNDKFENAILIIDDIQLNTFYDKSDMIEIYDKLKNLDIELSKSDNIEIYDKIFIYRSIWESLFLNTDKIEINESIDIKPYYTI